MSNLLVKDGASANKYLHGRGAGTDDTDAYITTNNDFHFESAAGNINKVSCIHKFGKNPAVGTSFVPVTQGGVYQTPQVSGATTLRIKAGGNANDTAAGSGAREITFEGLDETGAYVTEALATAGASASSATTTTFMRLFRVYVSASGTYATATAGSHSAAIVIENGSGGTDWATIENTDFSRGQSQIGAYTVPLGKTAYLHALYVSVDSSKSASVIFFKRENILETAAPYSGMRLVLELGAISGEEYVEFKCPQKFPALTDIGFLAKTSTGTSEVDIDMEITLVDD
jgi:hypothetical protein